MKNIALVISVIAILLISAVPLILAEKEFGNSGNGTGDGNASDGNMSNMNESETGDAKGLGITTTLKERIRERAKNFLEDGEYRLQLKDRVKLCLQNASEENCTQIKEEAIEATKGVLEGTIEKLSTHIASIKEKMETSEKLTDEEKAAVLEALEKQEEKLADLSARLEEADSFEEIKLIAKELRNLAHTIKFKVIDLVNMRRLGLVVERAEHLEAKLNATLDAFEAKGYDISSAEELLNDFNDKISKAKASYTESKELWQQFYEMVANNTIEGRSDVVQQAHDKMKEAQSYLGEAHDALKQILQELRELGSVETPENKTNLSE